MDSVGCELSPGPREKKSSRLTPFTDTNQSPTRVPIEDSRVCGRVAPFHLLELDLHTRSVERKVLIVDSNKRRAVC
jgi:hypothetical protein